MDENAVKKEEILAFLNQKMRRETNPFDKAALMRQLGYLRYQEALRAGEEGVPAFVANQYLQEYTSFVTENSPSSVNNYSAEVTRLLKARPTPVNPLKWTPVLEEFDYYSSEKDALTCNGTYFDCKHLEAEELNVFSDFDSMDQKIEAMSSQDLNSDDRTLQDEQILPRQAAIKRTLPDQHGKPSFSIVQINKSCQTDPIPLSGLSLSPLANARNKNRTEHLTKPFDNYNSKSNPPKESKSEEPSFSGFRTAREELVAQTFKKCGTNSSSHQQLAATYGTSNKSLGGRRSVKNNFVPPVQPVADELQKRIFGDPKKPQQEDPMDERLKNIDPKMVELINNEIMHKFNPVDWNDIAGLDYAKSTIQEAVVWPLLRPDIFTGIRRPPRGILLFGPPGTGKTLIGKCIASQSKSTFFSISASALTSKWVGDGEKMVRALFAVAAIHQPAVIFIDEIDSLLSQRSNDEHESSRRIKTEFLVQLDGAGTSQEDRLLIVGATNRPQELDEAARRRLVRRLYIPLPELEARKQILKHLLKSVSNSVTEDQLYEIGRLSEGYSGADMECLCREASMEPIRCIPASQIPYFNQNEVRPVNIDDFRLAITRVKASVSQDDIEQYITWNKTFGSGK